LGTGQFQLSIRAGRHNRLSGFFATTYNEKMKTLVYYAVGYDPRFLEAADLSIQTLWGHASVKPDILILCDKNIQSGYSNENVAFFDFQMGRK